jgi:hypothetical protein
MNFMHRAVVLIIMVVLSWLLSGCGPKISPQEAKVLVALDEIQRGVEAGIDYEKFGQLLGTAKAEIDMLKPNDQPNPCFLSAVEKAYASYEIAGKAWKRKMTEADEKRKADMDMALSFSLSFSSINIKMANQCYE